MTSELLRVVNIYKSFPGVQALKNVSMSVNRGEIMALVGENGAGKSTLMNILSGIHQKDAGKIYLDGSEIEILSPSHSQRLGISIIHQELNLLPHFSIGENIFMGHEKTNHQFLIDRKSTNNEAARLLEQVGLQVSVTTLVKDLSIAQQQLVEVAKSLARNAKLIVMDEPTSSLTGREVDKLMEIVRKLKSQGNSIIFISHKLDEIFKIADRVTVMRDGEMVGTLAIKDCSEEILIQMMVGREIKNIFAQVEEARDSKVVLEVKGLSAKGKFRDVSFRLKQGEILGFAGLVGAGRSEVMQAIFGVDCLDSGEIFIAGQKCQIKKPQDAIALGLGFVPEDRKQKGLMLGMAIKDNISIASLEKVSRRGVLDFKAEKSVCQSFIAKLSIKAAHQKQKALNLSGGNQQKVVIAKWLAIRPKVLILDEPTRGVDVGAKKEIYSLISQLTREGVSIIMVSSELPEVLGMSNRIIVMHEGMIKGELSREEATQEKILTLAIASMSA